MSVEYLVTGNTVTLDNLKPEVMSISKILNRFSERDLKLISDLINRLEKNNFPPLHFFVPPREITFTNLIPEDLKISFTARFKPVVWPHK